MVTLFTLPPHLQATISALAQARVAPPDLQHRLESALHAAEDTGFEDEAELLAEREIVSGGKSKGTGTGGRCRGRGTDSGWGKARDKENETRVPNGATMRTADANDTQPTEKEDDLESDASPPPPTPTPRPATIDGDLLEELASWCGRHSDTLASAGLDPSDYGEIALLAGTTVYLPPRQRALAFVAEKAVSDRPNPYLPRHLSTAQSPRTGSEYRSLLDTLGTILNVLFSIFGAGGAAYAAATGGAGWTREGGLLLAVLVGVVVGVADVGLLYLYHRKKRAKKAAEAELRVRENRGSGKAAGTEPRELPAPEVDAEAEDEQMWERKVEALLEMDAQKGENSNNVPSSVIPPPKPPTTNIRLRRRAL